MIIKLPCIDPIDTLDVPNDFEENVKDSFKRFTQYTNPKYTHEDKLLYLDNLRGYLHPSDSYNAVKNLIMVKAEFELDEYGNFPDKDDYWNMEFMCDCYEKGDKPLRDTYEKKSSSANDQTLKVIFEIIKIVVNWSGDDE